MSDSVGKARHCDYEQPAVYEAAGATVGQALRRLGKHPHLQVDHWAHGCVVLHAPREDDDTWVAVLFVS